MIDKISNSRLFRNMKTEDIENILRCSRSEFLIYEKDEIIFNVNDMPKFLYILVSGSISVCKDTREGDRNIINVFSSCGDIFGEVYIFMESIEYDFYCIVNEKSVILKIPKEFFFLACDKSCNYHKVLIQNVLCILAKKTYNFKKKLDIVSGGTLRQKIAKFLLANYDYRNNMVYLRMSRMDLANYLNVARPSLSRELSNMQKENLITMTKNSVKIISIYSLKEIV